MSLQQRLAGNATSSLPFKIRSEAINRMRTIVPIITAVLALALPATSSASDPILSGYGGPGNAEQAVLGGGLVTPPSGGSGSGGAGATADESLRATSTSSGSTSSSSSSAKSHNSSSTKSKSTTNSSSSTAQGGAAGAPTAAPKAIAYPTRQGGTGGLPLSGTDVLIVLLALVALAAGGLGLRRMATAASKDPSSPQASV
jgi:hypothetical protein